MLCRGRRRRLPAGDRRHGSVISSEYFSTRRHGASFRIGNWFLRTIWVRARKCERFWCVVGAIHAACQGGRDDGEREATDGCDAGARRRGFWRGAGRSALPAPTLIPDGRKLGTKILVVQADSIVTNENGCWTLRLLVLIHLDVNPRRICVPCIDEPDAHLSTRVQGKLLKELYKLIPNSSQLWFANHSISMVRAAQQIYAEDPHEVVFLDFGFDELGGIRDFDQAQTIRASSPDLEFRKRHYAGCSPRRYGKLASTRLYRSMRRIYRR